MKKILFVVIVFSFCSFGTCSKKTYFQNKDFQQTEIENNRKDFIKLKANIEERVLHMSLTEKIYQVFMLSVSGSTPSSVVAKNFKYTPAAVILYGFNFTHKPETVRAFIEAYINAFQENHTINTKDSKYYSFGIMPFFATDNEGGKVFRTSKLTSKQPAPFDVASRFSLNEAMDLYSFQASQMQLLGVSMNLAPICEVSNDKKTFLGKRAFSTKANVVSNYSDVFVKAHQDKNIACVLKHFPDTGFDDPHHNISVVEGNDLLTACKSFYKPLKKASAVMLSHSIIKSIDDKPFCLSKKGIDFLVNNLEYGGIIMSDDIIMKALKPYGKNYSDLAYKLLMAGCDMILYSAPDFNTIIDNLVEKCKSEKDFELRINEAVKKILLAKVKIGLIDLYGENLFYSSSQNFDTRSYIKIKEACDNLIYQKGF